MFQFPKDFFWGGATSSHQVEGNNIHNDWWEWEQKGLVNEPSLEACRSYELFREDFDLAKSLHHNCHRLSIEWSRIEPRQGEWSEKELEHYKRVIRALRERQLEPIVTLHHFTIPAWLAHSGGWLQRGASGFFLEYARRVVTELGEDVRFWVTINEPLVYVFHSYYLGVWPPQEKSLLKAKAVADRLSQAHTKTYRLIHRIYKEKNWHSPMVSIAKNVQAFQTCRQTWKNHLAVYLRDWLYNLEMIRKFAACGALDYIGLNYYSRNLVDTKSWRLGHLLSDTCKDDCSRLKQNSLGWDIYPEGLHQLLLSFKRFGLPLFILENGVCTDDDELRWEFIYTHLRQLSLAMEKGVSCLGYVYWSLIDNFEWDKGFAPRFGLINVDYATYKRSVRESSRRFARVCEAGVLEP